MGVLPALHADGPPYRTCLAGEVVWPKQGPAALRHPRPHQCSPPRGRQASLSPTAIAVTCDWCRRLLPPGHGGTRDLDRVVRDLNQSEPIEVRLILLKEHQHTVGQTRGQAPRGIRLARTVPYPPASEPPGRPGVLPSSTTSRVTAAALAKSGGTVALSNVPWQSVSHF